MSRVTPPTPGAGSGQPNPQRPTNPQASSSAAPGVGANKPNVTPPKAPTVGASAPPTGAGRPANMVPPRPGGGAAPGAAKPSSNLPGAAKPPAGGAPTGGGAGSTMPPIDQLQGRPIGRVLTKMGKVTREQVVEALTFQKSKGGALGRILIDLGYIKEVDLNTALAAQRGYELVNLDGVNIPPEAISAVPAQIATTNKVLPVSFDKASKKLTVVMASHENFRALDDLRSLIAYN